MKSKGKVRVSFSEIRKKFEFLHPPAYFKVTSTADRSALSTNLNVSQGTRGGALSSDFGTSEFLRVSDLGSRISPRSFRTLALPLDGP
jgi:hypothetical protein